MPFISNGTTILDNGAFSVGLGSKVLIKEITASADATISFVDGTADVVLDSTYPIYKFEFINMHPATDNTNFSINFSTDSGSNYNVTKTTTAFNSYQGEAGDGAGIYYDAGRDLAQGTGIQFLTDDLGNDNDHCGSGELFLFNPSSTTFVKHFISKITYTGGSNVSYTLYVAGYANTTSAVDAIRFQMDSGNIDAGKIKLYGIKDS